MSSNRITLSAVLVCLAVGSIAAGCGGSDSTTSDSVATEAQAAVSSAAAAATSAADGATADGASVAEDLKERVSTAIPSLGGLIESVDVNEADGSATVTTTLDPADTGAGLVESACTSVKQAMGGSTNSLTILGAGGATIASC